MRVFVRDGTALRLPAIFQNLAKPFTPPPPDDASDDSSRAASNPRRGLSADEPSHTEVSESDMRAYFRHVAEAA